MTARGQQLTIDTLSEYVEVGDCWRWLGTIERKNGYGRASIGGHRRRMAHRLVYEMLAGPIPDGLQLDHLCRNRPCVNPDHLEPVTPREHARRSVRSTRTHCAAGHRYTPGNTRLWRGTRICRDCHLVSARTWRDTTHDLDRATFDASAPFAELVLLVEDATSRRQRRAA